MIQWNEFFRIISIEGNHPSFSAVIEFNPGHEIFKGHFPGNPVVPGVCMVQIIKILLKDISKKELTMRQASQLKFLAIINPNENKTVQVQLGITKEEGEEIAVTGSIHKNDLVFLKYKAVFKKQ